MHGDASCVAVRFCAWQCQRIRQSCDRDGQEAACKYSSIQILMHIVMRNESISVKAPAEPTLGAFTDWRRESCTEGAPYEAFTPCSPNGEQFRQSTLPTRLITRMHMYLTALSVICALLASY